MLSVDRHQRHSGNLHEDIDRRRVRMARTQGGDALAQRLCGRAAFRRMAGQHAEAFERARDVLRRARFADEDRHAERAQFGHALGRRARAPDDGQIGRKAHHGFAVERIGVGDARHAFRLGGIVGISAGADDLGAGTDREKGFGRGRRQGHDAARRSLQT